MKVEKNAFFLLGGQHGGQGANCRLHPLIHTLASENSALDIEKKKAEPKTPHFLSLNQDIVASPQDEKCGLKYFIHNPGAQSGLQMSRFH